MKQACSLESMVDAVLSEMKRRGNAKNTIERHERAYSQFYEYALTQGENSYSKVLARSFLEEKEKLSAYRGPRFMEQYRIALNKLDDIAKGQDIRLRHLENGYHLKSSCFDWVIPFFEERLKRRLKNTYAQRGTAGTFEPEEGGERHLTALLLVACVGMITGAFFIFRISPMDFTLGVFRRLTTGPKSIRDDINETTQRKKPGFFRREIMETQTILQATGKEQKFPALCAASLLLFAIGAGIAIVMNNFLLVPVLAAGMMFLPFWYIKLTAGHYKKDIAAELETALSIITTAYLRSEDLQTAVEENINYLNPPVHGVFRSFLLRIKHIDPNMDTALAELKTAIDNEVWQEWCEALAACQYDRSLKTTLNPIVAKLSDMRIINGELENLVFGPRKEFISMAALVVLNIPLLYFLNKDWYATLMNTIPGKAVLVVCAAAIFISFAKVVKLTQPIEYRR